MKTLGKIALIVVLLGVAGYVFVHATGRHFEAKYETQEKMGQ